MGPLLTQQHWACVIGTWTEMTFPGVKIVIGCILSVLLAWDVVDTLFGHAHISWLLAGGCGRSSDPS